MLMELDLTVYINCIRRVRESAQGTRRTLSKGQARTKGIGKSGNLAQETTAKQSLEEEAQRREKAQASRERRLRGAPRWEAA